MEMETVVCIAVLCYLVGMVAKATSLKDKFIPVVIGVAGAILGAAALYVVPGFPADNLLDAMAVGAWSGLASTGANQFAKQLKREE